MAFHRLGQLEGGGRIVGWSVRHGRHPDQRGPVCSAMRRENDDAGAVLDAFLATGPVFVVPKVGVGDDQSGLRIGQRHERSA